MKVLAVPAIYKLDNGNTWGWHKLSDVLGIVAELTFCKIEEESLSPAEVIWRGGQYMPERDVAWSDGESVHLVSKARQGNLDTIPWDNPELLITAELGNNTIEHFKKYL